MAKQNFYTYPSMEKQLKQWTVQYSAVLFDSGNLFRCMEGGEDFDVLLDAVLACDVPRGPK